MVKRNNVVDFFSRRPLTDANPETDKLVDARGKYLGVLRKPDAEEVRQMVSKMEMDSAQIHHLIAQWQAMYDEYALYMADLLVFLGVEPNAIDPTEDQIFVDQDGHVWAVPKPDNPLA